MSEYRQIGKFARKIYGIATEDDKKSIYDVNLRRMNDTTAYVNKLNPPDNVNNIFHDAMNKVNEELTKIESVYGHDIEKMRYAAMSILVPKLKHLCDPDLFHSIVKLVFITYEIDY